MKLTTENYWNEIEAAPLKKSSKFLLKQVINCTLKKLIPPAVTQKEMDDLYNDMSCFHGPDVLTCSVSLDRTKLYHFMVEGEDTKTTKRVLRMVPWTLEHINLFKKTKTLHLNPITAGNYHEKNEENGMEHPAVYNAFGIGVDYLVEKTSRDWRGVNLFIKDPTGRMDFMKHGKEGEYTIVNVNPNMNIFYYWQCLSPIRNQDGNRVSMAYDGIGGLRK